MTHCHGEFTTEPEGACYEGAVTTPQPCSGEVVIIRPRLKAGQ